MKSKIFTGLLAAATAVAIAVIAGGIHQSSAAQAKSSPAGELRCGWYANPTPANHYLIDRDGRWTLMLQGAPGAPGFENLPDMTTNGWVATNGSYGHGCGCVRLSVNRRAQTVTRIYSGMPVPLAQCRADKRLPRP